MTIRFRRKLEPREALRVRRTRRMEPGRSAADEDSREGVAAVVLGNPSALVDGNVKIEVFDLSSRLEGADGCLLVVIDAVQVTPGQ